MLGGVGNVDVIRARIGHDLGLVTKDRALRDQPHVRRMTVW
jgi:hypothetical protein